MTREGLIITMASAQETRLQLALWNAIKEVEQRPEPASQKAALIAYLKDVREKSTENSVRQDYHAKQITGVSEEQFLESRLADVANSLSGLAALGLRASTISSKSHQKSAFCRQVTKFAPNCTSGGSTWSKTRTNVFRAEMAPIRQLFNYAISVRNTDQTAAKAAWDLLETHDKIPRGLQLSSAKISDLDGVKYHVDHKYALSLHWMHKGYNQPDDSSRTGITVERENLRLITAKANLSKGSGGLVDDDGDEEEGKFIRFVGPKFRSIHADGGAENAMSIDGLPLTDAAGNRLG